MFTRRQTLKLLAALNLGQFGTAAASSANQLPNRIPDLADVRLIEPNSPLNGPNFNAYVASTFKQPRLRAMCQSAEGVAAVVQWAVSNEVPFAVRSTGHSFTGQSQHDVLVIDTSQLNTIHVDPNNRRVSVGAGARNGAVSIALAAHEQGLGGGTHESVGLAGTTLGGGLGYFTRHAGMLCDQLLSLTLVDATGRIRTVSRETDADLFWACCGGGGGSLGVVTDLTFETFSIPILTYVDAPIIVDAVNTAQIIDRFQDWIASLPHHTTIHMKVSLYVNGQFLLNFSGMSLADKSWLMDHFQDLFGSAVEVADQWFDDRGPTPIMERLYGVPHVVSSLDFIGKTRILVSRVPLTGTIEVLSAMLRHPVGAVHLNFEALGGKASQKDTTDTAYPHRAAHTIVHLTKTILPHEDRTIALDAMEDAANAIGRYSTSGEYVNYPDADRDNWASAYWGQNLAKLIRVKRRIDPNDVFKHSQSIPIH